MGSGGEGYSKAYFRVLKKGRHLSIALEMNLLRALILPVSIYTSFTIFGEVISNMARIFFGLAFIPYWDTINPMNFPNDTLKVHLLGFNLIWF